MQDALYWATQAHETLLKIKARELPPAARAALAALDRATTHLRRVNHD